MYHHLQMLHLFGVSWLPRDSEQLVARDFGRRAVSDEVKSDTVKLVVLVLTLDFLDDAERSPQQSNGAELAAVNDE